MFNWEHLDIIVGVVTKGLFWTVVISVTSIIIGYFIGLATGFSRARNIRILKSISAFYVWIIRSTPILVQALYNFDGHRRRRNDLSGWPVRFVEL